MSIAGEEVGIDQEWTDYNRDWGNLYNDDWEGVPDVIMDSWNDHVSHLFGDVIGLSEDDVDDADYEY